MYKCNTVPRGKYALIYKMCFRIQCLEPSPSESQCLSLYSPTPVVAVVTLALVTDLPTAECCYQPKRSPVSYLFIFPLAQSSGLHFW